MHAAQLNSAIRPRRVLVVDDDPGVRELVTTRLDLAGCDTREARNGQQAIDRIPEFRPEAMVLDLNMPVVDGFEVLTYLQRSTFNPLPTLVLTARNTRSDVARCIRLGATDYLAKPFRDHQLLLRVARLLVAANRAKSGPLSRPEFPAPAPRRS